MIDNLGFYYYGLMILVFFLGACLGSFLNVILYRIRRKENWVSERSKCEKCGRQIAWYENIPLVSWLVLRGKCRTCQEKISLIHPLVELMMGLWFVAVFVIAGKEWVGLVGPWHWVLPLFWIGMGTMLILVVVIDGQQKIIPNWLILMILIWVIGLKGMEIGGGILSWVELGQQALIGVGTGLCFYILHLLALKIYGRDGFGLGDVKFLAVLGFWVGWPKIAVLVFLAFMLGAIGGVIWLLVTGKRNVIERGEKGDRKNERKKDKRKTEIPFGPFIVLATILAVAFGDYLWQLVFF